MPRIIDAFLFYNENDVLDIRLQELNEVVDQFVLVQSTRTFRGVPKPDYLDYERFAKYLDKIHVYNVGGLGSKGQSTWEREALQRNAIRAGLEAVGWEKGDTAIISDVDEIPRRSVVRPVDRVHRLKLDKYSYAINMLTDEGNDVVRFMPCPFNGAVQEWRYGDLGTIIENAGWEFSSLGNVEHVVNKLRSFSHSEFDSLPASVIAENIAAGRDLLGRDIKMTPVEIDDTFPEAIKADRKFWSKYEWKSGS